MKCWSVTSLGEPQDAIRLQQREIPEPGPAEALVRVAAAGIGLPDVLMCRGKYAFKPELPFTPGQEVAGVVTAVGEGSTAQIGDRVMGVTAFYSGNGGFADYCLLPDHSRYPVAGGMSAVEAAGFCIPYHTAMAGLRLRADIQPGEVLLVHGGAGGSGATAIRLGKALGAQIIATAGSDDKLRYCRGLGADHAINYREDDFVAEVLERTDNRGADVVYDPVGGEIFEKSVSCTASGGRLLAIGFASGRWGTPDTQELVMRNCSNMGVFVGAYAHDQLLGCHLELLDLYRAGKIEVPLDASIDFEDVGHYLGRLARREVQGKIVVHMGAGFE